MLTLAMSDIPCIPDGLLVMATRYNLCMNIYELSMKRPSGSELNCENCVKIK